MIYDCIIIGAGASGLFCSSTIEHPINGLILEKTKRPGTKLLMSGSGQCNITHDGSIKDFVSCYGKNGKKIRNCLYKYNNLSLVDFLEKNNIKTITRPDGKIFPKSMDAHDILDLLLRKTSENGFTIKYETPLEHIEKTDFGFEVHSGMHSFATRMLIIASGGCSYPTTGSDGSVFDVLKRDLNMKITDLKPALSSIQIADYPYNELSGISFENAAVSVWKNNKKIAENEDALLFTHNDLSGPAILNISKYASPGDSLKINYLGSLRYEQVLEQLKKAMQNTKADLANVISAEFELPKRFCHMLTKRYGNSLKKLANQLTSETFNISNVSGFNKAMSTYGGIELSQFNLSSMECKTIPGLFSIGEALDIDGITGGYNLQFAYSSARAANNKISEKLNLL